MLPRLLASLKPKKGQIKIRKKSPKNILTHSWSVNTKAPGNLRIHHMRYLYLYIYLCRLYVYASKPRIYFLLLSSKLPVFRISPQFVFNNSLVLRIQLPILGFCSAVCKIWRKHWTLLNLKNSTPEDIGVFPLEHKVSQNAGDFSK